MITLRIYSLNNLHVGHTEMVIMFIVLYIIPLALLYLITGSLYLLTAFIQFLPLPLPHPTTFGNYKPDRFF